VKVLGHRKSKGVVCALVANGDTTLAAGAGWDYRGRFKGASIFAPPAGYVLPLPEVGETFMGRMTLVPAEKVLRSARLMTRNGDPLSKHVGTDDAFSCGMSGVWFRYVPGKGVGIEEKDRRVYRLISDDFVITEVCNG
jgi:hypothetical protein